MAQYGPVIPQSIDITKLRQSITGKKSPVGPVVRTPKFSKASIIKPQNFTQQKVQQPTQEMPMQTPQKREPQVLYEDKTKEMMRKARENGIDPEEVIKKAMQRGAIVQRPRISEVEAKNIKQKAKQGGLDPQEALNEFRKRGFIVDEQETYGQYIAERALEQEQEILEAKRKKEKGALSSGELGLAKIKEYVKTVRKVGYEGMGRLLTKGREAIPEEAKEAGEEVLTKLGQTRLAEISSDMFQAIEQETGMGEKVLQGLGGVTEGYDELERTNPEAYLFVTTVSEVLDLAGLVEIPYWGGRVALKGASKAKKYTDKVVDITRNVAKLPPKTKQIATRQLPIAIIEKDLKFTPTERRFFENKGEYAGNFMLRKDLGGLSSEDRVLELAKMAEENYNEVSNITKNIKGLHDSNEAKYMLELMKEELAGSIITRLGKSKTIKAIEELLLAKNYTIEELQTIKRAFDKYVGGNIFKQGGVLKPGVENEIIVGWRAKVQKQIEDAAAAAGYDIKNLNDEVSKAIFARNAVLRSLSQKQKNNMLGLTDYLFGIGGALSGNPLVGAGYVIAKKTSTGKAPRLAQKLYNMSKDAKFIPDPVLRRGVPFVGDGTRSITTAASSAAVRRLEEWNKIIEAKKAKDIANRPKLPQGGGIVFQSPKAQIGAREPIRGEVIEMGRNAPRTDFAPPPEEPMPRGGKVVNVVEEKPKIPIVAKKVMEKKKELPPVAKQDLLQEARKYKSADEFVNTISNRHRPPEIEGANTLDNLSDVYPKDIYGPNGLRYYGFQKNNADVQSYNIIKQAKGKPDKEIVLYRAIVPGEEKSIKPGDWVTFSKDYAKQHGEGPLKGDYEIITKKVKAKELATSGDDLNEWGYRPNNHKDLRKDDLREIREQANKPELPPVAKKVIKNNK